MEGFSALNDQKRYRAAKYIGVAVVIAAVISYLFRGSFGYGMEFDEVYRLNNLIPLFNKAAYPAHQSIFNLHICGMSIPLMFKRYISSLAICFYLPMGLFKNYLFAVRFLDFFYFYMSIIGLFLIAAKYDIRLAFVISLLVATSPLFYPDIRFGSADSYHVFFIVLSLHLFYKYFNKTNSLVDLFLAVFFLAFAANVRFYVSWIIAAMILAGVICFPQYLRYLLSSFSRIAVVVCAFVAGLFNFVIYNVVTGFATFRPLYLRIFKTAEYNENPIDHKIAAPLSDAVTRKLNLFLSFLGPYFVLYVLVGGIIILAYGVAFYALVRQRQLGKYRIYFFPVVTCLFILTFILISPNTTRAGHYTYLFPFFQISLVAAMLLTYKLFGKYKTVKAFVMILPVFVIILNFYSSNLEVAKANKTCGTLFFSPAIYDLKSYLDQKGLDYNDVIHTEWGMYGQLYFLNKGERPIRSIWQLIGTRTDRERQAILTSFFTSGEGDPVGDFYFPVYNNLQKDIRTSLFQFIESNGGRLIKVKQFYEKSGDPIFALYKLPNSKEFVDRFMRKSRTQAASLS
jgi:hypothetical protein